MKLLFDEHYRFLNELINNHVLFLVIGGYAVNYYGYNRTTGDLDIWLQPDNENKEKLILTLGKFDFVEEDVNRLEKANFEETVVFSIWDQPYTIEFLTRVSGVDFQKAFQNRTNVELEGLKIPFIGFNELIVAKMQSTRLRDKADVEELQKIRGNQ